MPTLGDKFFGNGKAKKRKPDPRDEPDDDKETPPHEGYRVGGKGKSRAGRHGELDENRLPTTADPKKSKRIGRPPGQHRKKDGDG